MNDTHEIYGPFRLDLPASPAARRRNRIGRIVAVIVLAAALIVPAIQFQALTARNQRRHAEYETARQNNTLTEKQLRKGPPKKHKGAIGRWAPQLRWLWRGENIYQTPAKLVERRKEGLSDTVTAAPVLHPNMPTTAVLLSPFAFLPPFWAGLVFTTTKVLAVAAGAWATARACSHMRQGIPDWVFALGAVWWITLVISDIQHGNTNGFVFAAIALHLWLYRRGNNPQAGAALALAVCLKMTPALFMLYWLYQRNWKLLGGFLAAMLLAVALPMAAFGPARGSDLYETWYDNLIRPGLVEAKWYPIHINQSLPAVMGRYFLDQHPGGNIDWNPDDNPYHLQTQFRWIAFTSMDPKRLKRIVQVLQGLIVLVTAGAIGWRRLPRDDGRRGLHYAMILSAMMLLNQRTWTHHAAVLLPATVAVWYAIGYGRMRRGVRWAALGMMLTGGVALVATFGDLLVGLARLGGADKPRAEDLADRIVAYGPDCLLFLLLWGSAVILSIAMRKRTMPYAMERQTLATRLEDSAVPSGASGG